MAEVIVIGAGASGMAAAVSAARAGAETTLLEGMEKPGKKLFMTGNGKCNLTNTSGSLIENYRGENPGFAEEILGKLGAEEIIRFFRSIGLLTREKNGYVYPYNEQASAVADLFLEELRRLGVKVKCFQKVEGISFDHKKHRWRVHTEGWTYEADSVILACGSKAAPVSGSDGSGYLLAESVGHHIIKPLPGLVPLKVKEKFVKNLSGIRSSVRLSYYEDGCLKAQEKGELQWTDYGISGIVVFQISGAAVRALDQGKRAELLADLMPEYSVEEIKILLKEKCSLNGIFQKKMVPVLLQEAGLKGKTDPSKWQENELSGLAGKIKGLRLTVTGSKSFEAAQVCTGGVDTGEIDPHTLESRLAPGLFLTGELLDIDAACGGFNLTWAFSSGITAGRAAAEREDNNA